MENILKFICSIQASPEAALELPFGSSLLVGTGAMGGLGEPGSPQGLGGFVLGPLLKIQTHLSKICSTRSQFVSLQPPQLWAVPSVLSLGSWHFLLELDVGFQQQKGPQ